MHVHLDRERMLSAMASGGFAAFLSTPQIQLVMAVFVSALVSVLVDVLKAAGRLAVVRFTSELPPPPTETLHAEPTQDREAPQDFEDLRPSQVEEPHRARGREGHWPGREGDGPGDQEGSEAGGAEGRQRAAKRVRGPR